MKKKNIINLIHYYSEKNYPAFHEETYEIARDKEYGKFVCKVLELKHFLETELKKHLSPRDIDNFLLSGVV